MAEEEGEEIPQGYIDEEEQIVTESPLDPALRDNERGFSDNDLEITMKVYIK